jgi:hypothetical protein
VPFALVLGLETLGWGGVDKSLSTTLRNSGLGLSDRLLLADLSTAQLYQPPQSRARKWRFMAVKIQQIVFKSIGAEISEDGKWGRVTIEATNGETIMMVCPIADYMPIAGTFLKTAVGDLMRTAVAAGLGQEPGHILRSQVLKTEQHVAGQVAIVLAKGIHTLLIDTLDKSQLQIMLLEPQLQALKKALS